MKDTIKSTGFLTALAAIGCILWAGTPSVCLAQTAGTAGKNGGGLPVRVEVMQPVKRPLKRMLDVPATLQPGESAKLFAKTSGYVERIAVDIGGVVKKGDELLVIDVPEMADELRQAQAVLRAKRAKVQALEAQVTQAESGVATAKANLKQAQAQFKLRKLTRDRMATLWKEKAIPDQKHDEAMNQLEMAEAMLDIGKAKVQNAAAQVQSFRADVAVGKAQVAVEEANVSRLETLMGYATLTAPFDGVITSRLVDPGAFVRSAAEGESMPLLWLANLSYIRVVLEIPESSVPFVRTGTAVSVNVKSLAGDAIQAKVTRTAVVLTPETRTMRVEVDLPNGDGRLTAGMYAEVSVTLSEKQSAMLIPSKAIFVQDGKTSVLVADGQVAKASHVALGYDDGIWVEVLSGLSGDERVIVSSGGNVVSGVTIKTTTTDDS